MEVEAKEEVKGIEWIRQRGGGGNEVRKQR